MCCPKYGIGAIGTDEVTAGAFPSFSSGGYEAFAENDGTKLKNRNYHLQNEWLPRIFNSRLSFLLFFRDILVDTEYKDTL